MTSYCVHNYLNGNCQVAGPSCPPATVEQRLDRLNAHPTTRAGA